MHNRTNLGFGVVVFNDNFHDTPVTADFLVSCGYYPVLFASSHYELNQTINNYNSEIQRKLSTNEGRIEEIVHKYEYFDETSYFDADEREFALLNRKRDLLELEKLRQFRPNKLKAILVCGNSEKYTKWNDITNIAINNKLTVFVLMNSQDPSTNEAELVKRGADGFLPIGMVI